MIVATSTTKKIGIFRALQLGDLLCTVPAMRALRKAYPLAEIVLIGMPWAESFVNRFHKYLDRFMHFPGYHGLPEQPFDAFKYDEFVSEVRAENFDLVVQMQGNGTIVNEMLMTWGVKNLAGFTPGNSHGNNFLTYPEGIHEIKRHLRLMEHLGIAGRGTYLEFPITPVDQADFDKLPLFPKGEYVCIHPGSRGSYRQWPTEHFARAAKLCHDMGYGIVLTGINGEQAIVQKVKDELPFECIDLCGQTSLGTAALVIQNAAMIICNCTGVSHIASAMNTPGIIISMDGEPERWGPLNSAIFKTINWLEITDPGYVLNEARELLVDVSTKRNQLFPA